MNLPRSKDFRALARLFASVVCVLIAGGTALGDEALLPLADGLTGLDVQPDRVVLEGANRQQQVVVTATDSAGRLVDVTHRCRLEADDAEVATVSGSVVEGRADGTTVLRVSLAGLSAAVPVTVEGFDDYPPVHFRGDVIPVFTKLGCNSGGCHGKATGKGGFKLSVFGFDPAADYNAIVKHGRGRRVFPAAIERSLLLTKPLARVPHGGGRRLPEGSREHELLLRWLEQGMPWGEEGAPRAVRLEIAPAQRVVEFNGRQQLLVTAMYSDGSRRDVTASAIYASNAPKVAEVDEQGIIQTGHMPGEAAVTVSFLDLVTVARVQVPRPGGPLDLTDPRSAGPIDRLVWSKLRTMRIPPSGPCDDATFLRRASLDTIGTLPTPDEVRKFLADPSPDKRARLVDSLLAREEFADFWALKWADILLVDRDNLGDRGAFEFHQWLRRQFAENRPYDEWAAELITASGNSGIEGPVNFYRALRTPEELGQSVSQVFLGVRIECAQCHHHPWERWGREDFFGMAGFFNGLQRKPAGTDRELVFHAGLRHMKLPNTDEVVATRPLGADAEEDLGSGDPRVALARWLTSEENPWFARLIANRLWKHFLGRGLVEPEDDLRSTNPPTNEPLLDYLESRVVAADFDLKALMREILTSRVYQLSSVPNEANHDDQQNYSHYYRKRLPAEVLLDAVNAAAGTSETFPGLPPGTRAIELWNNRLPSYFLNVFGRPERTSPCECVRSSEPTMAQALHLMNAPEIETKLSDPVGRIARLVGEGAEPAEIVDQLCLAALGRMPAEKERRVAERLFAEAPPRQAAEDFLWTLLNSYDFLFIR